MGQRSMKKIQQKKSLVVAREGILGRIRGMRERKMAVGGVIGMPDGTECRPCHDCGQPVADYRCSACTAAWRKKHGVDEYDLEAR